MSNDYSIFNSYVAGGEHRRYVLCLDLERLARTKSPAKASQINVKFFSRGREGERPNSWWSEDNLFFFAPLFCFNDSSEVDEQIAEHDYSDFFNGFRVEVVEGKKRGVFEGKKPMGCLESLYHSLDGNEDDPDYDEEEEDEETEVFDAYSEESDYVGLWKAGLRPNDNNDEVVAERYRELVLGNRLVIDDDDGLEWYVAKVRDMLDTEWEELDELRFEADTLEENQATLRTGLQKFLTDFASGDAACLTSVLEWVFEHEERRYEPEKWDFVEVDGHEVWSWLDRTFLHADVYREVAVQILVSMGRSHHEALELVRGLSLTTWAGYMYPVDEQTARDAAKASIKQKKKKVARKPRLVSKGRAGSPPTTTNNMETTPPEDCCELSNSPTSNSAITPEEVAAAHISHGWAKPDHPVYKSGGFIMLRSSSDTSPPPHHMRMRWTMTTTLPNRQLRVKTCSIWLLSQRFEQGIARVGVKNDGRFGVQLIGQIVQLATRADGHQNSGGCYIGRNVSSWEIKCACQNACGPKGKDGLGRITRAVLCSFNRSVAHRAKPKGNSHIGLVSERHTALIMARRMTKRN